MAKLLDFEERSKALFSLLDSYRQLISASDRDSFTYSQVDNKVVVEGSQRSLSRLYTLFDDVFVDVHVFMNNDSLTGCLQLVLYVKYDSL